MKPPRSVADEEPVRSSLHAKCVVVDAERVFVSSANFTEAGQQRSIEVGLSIRSEWLAKRLIRHFKLLHEHSLAERAICERIQPGGFSRIEITNE
jgi:phosphatidylserine/phosphatidylglycerophosphate/cardiolipin synthase-like enzyme